MKTVVIDASVAIKWVVEEPGTAEALALRRFRLSAPDLLVAECANILWKKVRRGELGRAEALLAARLLERADVDLVPMRRMLESAAELATALDHPAYDCMYLSLAQSTGRSFVTADERLRAKVRSQGLPAQVLGLSNALEQLSAGEG
ncbi:type II toxin-antitoxin system VapC family toxin [Belnapia moabensis]|uniref:type II toxin-antitoxin system VapC family toxin n=1 Tax=Belnapia moabensis TaxID=365533 RepID=UPI0005BD15F1|nr:type II toxin-antitoxin system VapC family toxin [Belnapia moabensis]